MMPYKNKEKQKEETRRLRKQHHAEKLAQGLLRLDCYVNEQTKEGIFDAKHDLELKNEGAVIDYLYSHFIAMKDK